MCLQLELSFQLAGPSLPAGVPACLNGRRRKRESPVTGGLRDDAPTPGDAERKSGVGPPWLGARARVPGLRQRVREAGPCVRARAHAHAHAPAPARTSTPCERSATLGLRTDAHATWEPWWDPQPPRSVAAAQVQSAGHVAAEPPIEGTPLRPALPKVLANTHSMGRRFIE